MNNYPKIVFSRMLGRVGWKNVRLVHRNPVEEVSALKRQQGKDMGIYGSGERLPLKLKETRKFGSGAVLLGYRPVRED